MKQQMYENLIDQMVDAYFNQDNNRLANLMTKASILRRGGDQAASVIRELTNGIKINS